MAVPLLCRKPYHSLNFVIAHDGFTLADLCAYNDKHNDANGEGNRDGSNDNFSWNCGAEGATQDGEVLWRREKQMRNLMVALLVSQGMPMVLSGTPCSATSPAPGACFCCRAPQLPRAWACQCPALCRPCS